jgi:hypothetical protein
MTIKKQVTRRSRQLKRQCPTLPFVLRQRIAKADVRDCGFQYQLRDWPEVSAVENIVRCSCCGPEGVRFTAAGRQFEYVYGSPLQDVTEDRA